MNTNDRGPCFPRMDVLPTKQIGPAEVTIFTLISGHHRKVGYFSMVYQRSNRNTFSISPGEGGFPQYMQGLRNVYKECVSRRLHVGATLNNYVIHLN